MKDGYGARIWRSDLDKCQLLVKEDFEYLMCKFIAEVVKVKDGSDYPGCTLYQMCVVIQKYLFSNGLKWKLIEGDFDRLRNVLDNIMKDRAARCIGTVVKKAQFISVEKGNEMREKGILGEDNPNQLRDTVLFLLGLKIGLRAGDEHYYLRRDAPDMASQLQVKRNKKGVRCLVYTEDNVTKTNDGGLKSMRKERKIVWVYPSSNREHCPVRLVDKYITLLPPVHPNRKANFYLRSLEGYTPVQWYGEQVVGSNTIRKIMSVISKSAGLERFFINHSLRCSGTTYLFQARIDRKIIKEFTAHVSDAVDAYQATSDEQRQKLSEVIAVGVAMDTGVKCKNCGCIDDCELQFEVSENSARANNGCCCTKKMMKVGDAKDVGEMIQNIIKAKKGGKAVVKGQVEFDC